MFKVDVGEKRSTLSIFTLFGEKPVLAKVNLSNDSNLLDENTSMFFGANRVIAGTRKDLDRVESAL